MNLQDVLATAALKYGQDPSVLIREAQIESGLNPNARNPSGAAGLLQFMPGTARQYGLSNPYDPVASADAGARLLRDNRTALEKALGREPSAPELYLAHQQGAGGATDLLTHPDAPAASLVGADAVGQNGGAPDMTGQQFADLWRQRFVQPAAPDASAYSSGPDTPALDAISAAAPTGGAPSGSAPVAVSNSIPSFIFGGDTAVTPEDLARKRAMLASLAAGQAAPQNVGQGLNAIGQALRYKIESGRTDDAERAGQQSVQDAIGALGANPDNAAILKALSNPWLSQGDQSVLGALAQQNIKEGDPDTALGRQLKQAQIAALGQKDTKPIEINNKLVNPVTHEVLGDYSTPQITWAPVTPDEAKAAGLPTNVGLEKSSTGEIKQIGGVGAAPPAAVQEYQFAQGQGYKGSFADYQTSLKKAGATSIDFNQNQGIAAGFADRMANSNSLLSDPKLVSAMTDAGQHVKAGLPMLGNFLASADYQQAEQAQRDFINAILRRESGAAISPSEFDNARQQYFPQPGDSPAVIAQKAKNRQIALEGVTRSAGPNYQAPTIGGNSAANVPAAGSVVDGYRFKGGDPAQQANWEQVQ